MEKIVRQTGLSIQEIISFLDCDQCDYPECLLINELGAILYNAEDEDQMVEQYLVSLLEHDDEDRRALGAGFLMVNKDMAAKYHEILEGFRADEKNTDVNQTVDRLVKNFWFIMAE